MDTALCGACCLTEGAVLFYSALCACVFVWVVCICVLRVDRQNRTPNRPARASHLGRQAERQPASAQLATVRYAARDGHVHTGDPSAADANMSPALQRRPRWVRVCCVGVCVYSLMCFCVCVCVFGLWAPGNAHSVRPGLANTNRTVHLSWLLLEEMTVLGCTLS